MAYLQVVCDWNVNSLKKACRVYQCIASILKLGSLGHVNDREAPLSNLFIPDCTGHFVPVLEVLLTVVLDCCVFEIVMDTRGGGVVAGPMWIGTETVVVDVGRSITLASRISGAKTMDF